MSYQPRPILKSYHTGPFAQRHDRNPSLPPTPPSTPRRGVHFPPSPTLTRTFSAHSPAAYDRSPIVVIPNACALPERGCPGRTYTLADGSSSQPRASSHYSSRNISRTSGKHLHPRICPSEQGGGVALESDDDNDAEGDRTPTRTTASLPPPLIPDISSSESDESDSHIPMLPTVPFTSPSAYSPPRAHPMSKPAFEAYCTFLPHAPSPAREEERAARKRKEKERERRRIAKTGAVSESARYKMFDVSSTLQTCRLEDLDCLGGF